MCWVRAVSARGRAVSAASQGVWRVGCMRVSSAHALGGRGGARVQPIITIEKPALSHNPSLSVSRCEKKSVGFFLSLSHFSASRNPLLLLGAGPFTRE